MEKQVVKVYSDGGARGNPGPAASAYVVIENGCVVHKQSKYVANSTNNEAEYNALILGLRWLSANEKTMAGKKIEFYLDSELIVRQLKGLYKVKSSNLKPLFLEAKNLLAKIVLEIEFFAVTRDKNKLADALVNRKLDAILNGQ